MTRDKLEERYIVHEDGEIWDKEKNKFINQYITPTGYKLVCIKIDDKWKMFYTQRIIWEWFNGEIPDGMQVNHIDENKENNALSNLNLMTPKENSNWGTRNERSIEKQKGIPRPYVVEVHSKPVIALDSSGNVVKEYPSATEAARLLGLNQGHISACCKGKRKTCGGYAWKYA